jgi:hypothetical protein
MLEMFDGGIRRKKFPVVSGIILFCTGDLLGEKCEGLKNVISDLVE